jgi:hypothetical protein
MSRSAEAFDRESLPHVGLRCRLQYQIVKSTRCPPPESSDPPQDAGSVRTVAEAISSYETFNAHEDARQPGVCAQLAEGTTASVGPAIAVNDPVLANMALPLRIR